MEIHEEYYKLSSQDSHCDSALRESKALMYQMSKEVKKETADRYYKERRQLEEVGKKVHQKALDYWDMMRILYLELHPIPIEVTPTASASDVKKRGSDNATPKLKRTRFLVEDVE